MDIACKKLKKGTVTFCSMRKKSIFAALKTVPDIFLIWSINGWKYEKHEAIGFHTDGD